jgi:alpha-L-fucosidase
MECTRRQFMGLAAGAGATSLGLAAGRPVDVSEVRAMPEKPVDDAPQLPKPTPAQVAWQDCEIGLVYHFDLSIAVGHFAGNNTVRERMDPKKYNPTKLDTDQWIEAAKAAGAKYAVFTATHFNGFMQWQSDLYPYGLKQAAWRKGKGDVVGDFVESCRKADIAPGIYFSTHRNAFWEVWGHYVNWGKGKGTDKQTAFNRIAEKMTEELCSRYGPLVQIWYDAGVKTPEQGGPDVLPVFEKHQPNSVFYHSGQRSDHRWIGNEAGRASYPCWATMPGQAGAVSHNHATWKRFLSKGDPDGTYWSPGMADTPLRNHNWFWKPGQDKSVTSLKGLVAQYYQSVGRNCNYLLGEVVTSDGLVPAHDIERLTEFGKEIRRRFDKPVAETAGAELKLPKPARIDHVVIMEQIARGERIRAYEVEGLVAGGTWRKLCEGQSVGHKRIEQFDAVEVAAVRLKVTESAAAPQIRQLAVYDTAGGVI